MTGLNIVSLVFSLVGCTLEKATLDSGKLDLVSLAGSNGIKLWASLCADKKVTIYAQCFIQSVVVYSMRNPFVYRTPKK